MSRDNAHNMRAALAAAQRQKHRRYEWTRLRNDFADMPIWRAIARKTGLHLSYVIAVVVRLEALANRSTPRGSVAEMSIPEFAASLDLRPTVVARIRAALEEPDIAWIDQDYVVDFHERNPDHEDTTAAERQRRRRAKLKQERERAMLRPPATGDPPQDERVTRDTVTVTRDIVTVTPRADQTIHSGGSDATEPDATCSDADEAVSREDAEHWLATEGCQVITERMRIPPLQARTAIARWRRQLGEDPFALAAIIRAAAATTLVSAQFHVLISDQINRRRLAEKGPPLPIPPVPLKRSSTNG
jgi:hypothetical protein